MKNPFLVILFVFYWASISAQFIPTLIYPADSQITDTGKVQLLWDTIPAVANLTYEVEIATDKNFSSIVFDSAGIDAGGVIANALPNLSQYFWRVRSFDGFTNSNWSITRSYYVCNLHLYPKVESWLKAGEGITTITNQVVLWSDQSGNGNDANQAVTASSPSLVTANLNGYDIIRFSNSKYLDLGTGLSGNEYHSIYCLWNPSTVSSSMVVHGGNNSSGNAPTAWGSLGIRLYSGTGGIDYSFGNGTKGSFGQSDPNIITAGQYYISTYMREKGLFLDSIYLNSKKLTLTQTLLQIDSISPNTNTFSIGRYGDYVSTFYFSGDIAEFIFINEKPSPDTSRVIEQYLKDKFFPKVNLGRNIIACDTFATLSIANNYDSIVWSTGDLNQQSITINTNGSYWVRVRDRMNNVYSDTIDVYGILNGVNFSFTTEDSTFCHGDSILWNTNLDHINFDFLWSNGSTDSLLWISTADSIYIHIQDLNACSYWSDILITSVDSFSLIASLGPDTSICSGANIGLLSGTEPGTNYSWNTLESTPEISIDTAGKYILLAINENGCILNDSIDLTINGVAPVIKFSISGQCSNDISLFTDSSAPSDLSNINVWTWDFGDTTTSTDQHTTHQYTSSGTYLVKHTVSTDSNCTNSLSKFIDIYVPPTAAIGHLSPVCSEQNTSFYSSSTPTDGAIISLRWDFGDINKLNDTAITFSPVYAYDSIGNYIVTLIATSEFACSDTDTTIITNYLSPIANYTRDSICNGDSVSFYNNSSGNIVSTSWTFSNGHTSTGNTAKTVFSDSTDKILKLIVIDTNNCTDTLLDSIIVHLKPVPNYLLTDFCSTTLLQQQDMSSSVDGNIISWQWYFNDLNDSSSTQNPTFSFSTADIGQHYLTLKVSTDKGCSDTLRNVVEVHSQPDAIFDVSTTIGDPPLTVDFTNQSEGALNYLWIFGNGNTSTDFSPTTIFTDSGKFRNTLVITSEYGCIDSATFYIEVLDVVEDIAITSIYYEFIPNTNYIKMYAGVANLGNVDINNFYITAYTDQPGKVVEEWTGTLSRDGAPLGYEFTGFLEVFEENPSLFCINVSMPNYEDDHHPDDNENCTTIEDLLLVRLQPIPTNGELTISYALDEFDFVEISLRDFQGKQVDILFSDNQEIGYHTHTFDLSDLNNGMYIIRLTTSKESIVRKIIKNG